MRQNFKKTNQYFNPKCQFGVCST